MLSRVRRVHDDAAAMIEYGLVEKAPEGKLCVPFDEIHADFVMKCARCVRGFAPGAV
jgi:hypothetical protein